MSDVRLRDDAPDLSPTVTLADLQSGSNASAVRLEPGDDARILLPLLSQLRRVDIAFPGFRDGRGYSAARILREAGYHGELRAVGDVLYDQIAFMRRCGFDAFAPDAPLTRADVDAACAQFALAYQSATDARRPIWALRHEA